MKRRVSPGVLTVGLIVVPMIVVVIGVLVQVNLTTPAGRLVAPPAPAPAQVQGSNPTLATGSAPPLPTPPPLADPVRRATDFAPPRPAWEGVLASGSAEQGQRISDAGAPGLVACSTCHGKGGVAPTEVLFPDLAGKQPEYIAKQLLDFRGGARINQVMTPIAQAMKDADIGAVAHYFGGLATPPRRAPDLTAERGATLDAWGDGRLGVPACANCHGVAARGGGAVIPPLAAQPREYFVNQMQAFRGDTRRNDDVGVMRALAKRLSDDDIRALADFYASMKTPAAGAP